MGRKLESISNKINKMKRQGKAVIEGIESVRALCRKICEVWPTFKPMFQANRRANRRPCQDERLGRAQHVCDVAATTARDRGMPWGSMQGGASAAAEYQCMEQNCGSKMKALEDLVRSSAETLLTVINGVLDFSKAEAGKIEF